MFSLKIAAAEFPGAIWLAGTPRAGVSRRIRATQGFGSPAHRALFLGQAPSIIPKVFGGPYLHHLEFQMSTENRTERRFVQVVKETFALHPLRVSIFEGQI